MQCHITDRKRFFTQYGIKISRGTMAHWTIFCAKNYFTPMLDYFHRCLSKRKYLCADEMPIQVLKEKDRRPQTKSYIWLSRSGDDGMAPIIIISIILHAMVMQQLISLRIILTALISWQMDMPDIIS